MKRRRPKQQPPWEHNWRNPDMLVLRTWLEVSPFGAEKKSAEVTPKESSGLSQENIQYEERHYLTDPSYYWAKEARRKRRK